MFLHGYSTNLRFFKALAPALAMLSLRGLFSLNFHALLAVARIALWRVWRAPVRLLRRLRQGPGPVTLQVVDDIRCGAHCTNCLFSAFQVRGDGLTLDELDRLFREAHQMDITHVYLMGADPFYRADPESYLALLARHRLQVFYLFSEGKRLSPHLLQQVRRAGNIVLMLNIDGLAEATNRRKGEGSWPVVEDLLERLRAARVPWFVTTMVSTANYDEVTSEAYVEYLSSRGCWVLAYLPYTPVDLHQEAHLVMSDAQREALYHRSLELNHWRRKLVVLDMLGIEQYLTSCPAGVYTITVYHDGTVAPCAAIPIGHRQSNIRDLSLSHIYRSDPLYRALRELRRQRRRAGEPLHCLFYGDARFLSDYLREHEEELVIINPSAAEYVHAKARSGESEAD